MAIQKLKYVILVCIAIITLSTPITVNAQTNTQQFNILKKKMQHLPPNQQHGTKRIKIGNTIYHFHFTQPKKPWYVKISSQQIQRVEKQAKVETLKDINVERKQHGRSPVKLNHKLDKLANIRAQQISTDFNHVNNKGQPMTTVDAKRVKLPKKFQASENIASGALGPCTVEHDPKSYYNHNGQNMADMSNDGMMNYDEFEQNGHRRNILDKTSTLVGIGVYYSPKKRTFYLAENFGNTNPNASNDIYNNYHNPMITQQDQKPTKPQINHDKQHMHHAEHSFIHVIINIFKAILHIIIQIIQFIIHLL